MRILKFLPAILGILALTALLAAGVLSMNHANAAAPVTQQQPAEDEPGWDCTVHGNQSCTPVAAPVTVPATATAPVFEYEEAVPWVPGAPINGEIREPYEDEPGFDCRIHSNQVCGVEIEGTWYIVSFAAGEPVGVHLRGF